MPIKNKTKPNQQSNKKKKKPNTKQTKKKPKLTKPNLITKIPQIFHDQPTETDSRGDEFMYFK